MAVTGSAWGTSLPLKGSVPFDSFLGFFKIVFLPDKMISGLKPKPMTKNTKHNVLTHQCFYPWKHQLRGLPGPCPAWAAATESGLMRNLKIRRRCLTSTFSRAHSFWLEMASLYTSPERLQVLESPRPPPVHGLSIFSILPRCTFA